MRTVFAWVLCLVLLAGGAPTAQSAFDPTYDLYAKVLLAFVDENGRVDYPSLKVNPQNLKLCLDQWAEVTESEFQTWTRDEQLAFFLNLYNAQTLARILEHYPLLSIRDIGHVFMGPWDQEVVRIFGDTKSLDYLEHVLIRKKYEEPRVHFALVCAAMGCPPLRREPYIAEKLDAQLEDQVRIFMATPQKNRMDVEKKTVYLSLIFKWFDKDFLKVSGDLLSFVEPYFSQNQAVDFKTGEYKIVFTDYDWTLNEKK